MILKIPTAMTYIYLNEIRQLCGSDNILETEEADTRDKNNNNKKEDGIQNKELEELLESSNGSLTISEVDSHQRLQHTVQPNSSQKVPLGYLYKLTILLYHFTFLIQIYLATFT